MKLSTKTLNLLTLISALMIAGCAKLYVPPTDLSQDTVVKLQGSKMERDGFFEASLFASIHAIDGLPVTNILYETPSWYDERLLSPGLHYIVVASMKGIYKNGAAMFKVSLEPGQTYVVRNELADQEETLIWIEKKDGTVITPKVFTIKEKIRSNPIPIFIPTK